MYLQVIPVTRTLVKTEELAHNHLPEARFVHVLRDGQDLYVRHKVNWNKETEYQLLLL